MVCTASISMLGEVDHDAGAVRLLHEIVEMLGEVGVDRLRRHEQDGGVLRLAGKEIAFGHGLDMTGDIDAYAPRRLLPLLVAPRGAERLEAFEGNLASITTPAGYSACAGGSRGACRSTASPGTSRRPSAAHP